MSKVKVPETTLKMLFDDGRLYSMQTYIDRWPEAWTPELETFIIEYNKGAAQRAAEAAKVAARRASEAAVERAYHRYDNFTLEDFCNIAKERLHQLHYLFEAFEGFNNAMAREIGEVIVHGNNALSRGVCGDNSRLNRERFINFIEEHNDLHDEINKRYKRE